MKNTTRHTAPISHEENQRLAYQLWEEASCPSGQALDFWLKAEEQLLAASQPQQGRASMTPGNGKSNGARANPKTAKRAMKAA